MIQRLSIENFKSIRKLDIDCRKINVFIGEPNAGKSNIVEALSLFSLPSNGLLRDFVRFKDLTDLFYDNHTDKDVIISHDSHRILIHYDPENFRFGFFLIDSSAEREVGRAEFDASGSSNVPHNWSSNAIRKNRFAFYKYQTNNNQNSQARGPLSVPYGNNLLSIIISNPALKKLVSDLFKSKDFRLQIKPIEREILISKERNDEIYSYSYNNISETLRRIIFFMACLETNQNAVLLFDEPEANTFPFYTKYLAERIALDETNQYFFTTHNPYLLRSLVEKADKKDILVGITYMENYETKIRVLKEDELSEILDSDIFFNLDLFLKDAANP